jgi:hypothetical protein
MMSSNNHNRRWVGGVGMAVGALLAPPLICLVASPFANADTPDVAAPGGDIATYTFGPDTLSINTTTGAFDNYIATSSYDLDVGAPASNSYEVLLTDPGAFQFGIDDVAGKISYIDIFNPANFLPPDPCLAELGGGVSTDAAGGLLSF